MDPVTIAAIGAGAASAGGGILTASKNRKHQSQENQRQRDWAIDMFNRTNQRDMDFWKMQNAYNDPSAQMQRLKEAGLNPHLVYGNGADAQAGPIATHSAPQPNTRALQSPEGEIIGNALGNGLFQYLDIRQRQSNIARTDAETRSVDAHTANREFLNLLNTSSTLNALRTSVVEGANKSHYDSEGSRIRYETDALNLSLAELATSDKELYAKAKRADLGRAVQELENAKRIGDKTAVETDLLRFEQRLNQMGIYRGSGDFSKIINGLWYSVFGQPIHQAGDSVRNILK